ncbi:hypothetical protein LIER_19537 [Lithospermum erythrorhizon]|uniref:Uncharacterized protein n=1 Tax=Lithospermum erythrorhizon TaxID=34254 RepID=A0AAV3QMF8_LITER
MNGTDIIVYIPDASTAYRNVSHVLAPILSTHALKEGVRISLFDDGIPKKVVAEGILISKDPKEKIINLPLGPDNWLVFLDEATCLNYIFSGIDEDGITIAQAINNFVAWPKVNVIEN